MVRGSNPGGGQIFPRPSRPALGLHAASYTMDTGSFPVVKRSGRGADHPPPSSTEVEGRIELYLYSPSWSSWSVLGWSLINGWKCNVSNTTSGCSRRMPATWGQCSGYADCINGHFHTWHTVSSVTLHVDLKLFIAITWAICEKVGNKIRPYRLP